MTPSSSAESCANLIPDAMLGVGRSGGISRSYMLAQRGGSGVADVEGGDE